jgi:Ser/Thr protein kinase RdoA (MazF antagonist)
MDAPVPELVAIAEAFGLPGRVRTIAPLGNGNVNDTFRVQVETSVTGQGYGEGDPGTDFVLQRLNTQVFLQPQLVMRNLQVLSHHAQQRPVLGQRWEVPRVIANRHTGEPWVETGDQFWRLLTFVNDAVTLDAITNAKQARQVGRGLGLFHNLISDLPADQLADTLPGFHITPGYLAAYDQTLESSSLQLCDRSQWCFGFVEQRRELAPLLEAAKAAGRLQLRPIHGDPKVNNVMLCARTGIAVSLVDLDTVKPGLVQYDIGDCLRSACNRLGEEAGDGEGVSFDLEFCQAMLQGYLGAARSCLSTADLDHIFDAARLISFELGLRFFSDHLAGDSYFRTSRPGHNLDRARVQFRLTESIEAQEAEIRAIVDALR